MRSTLLLLLPSLVLGADKLAVLELVNRAGVAEQEALYVADPCAASRPRLFPTST